MRKGGGLLAVFKDPFAGKCIHGRAGAIFVDNKLVNPKCAECVRAGRSERDA